MRFQYDYVGPPLCGWFPNRIGGRDNLCPQGRHDVGRSTSDQGRKAHSQRPARKMGSQREIPRTKGYIGSCLVPNSQREIPKTKGYTPCYSAFNASGSANVLSFQHMTKNLTNFHQLTRAINHVCNKKATTLSNFKRHAVSLV